MTDDEIFEQLTLLEPYPAKAVAAAEERYDQLLPRIIEAFEAWIAAPPEERVLPSPLFLLFHLLGSRSERRAYATLVRFLRQHPAGVAYVLEDAISESAGRVLAQVCDGDPGPLVELAYDAEAHPHARAQALEAIAGATMAGTLDIGETEALLRRVHDDAPAPDGAPLWESWQRAIAALRLESLRPLVEAAFESERIISWMDDIDSFEETLRREPGDEEDILVEIDFAPVSMSDAFLTMRGASCLEDEDLDLDALSDEEFALMEEALADDPFLDGGGLDDVGLDEPERPTPFVDPWRKVGRNDPCPCGSGKKFKKCHGA